MKWFVLVFDLLSVCPLVAATVFLQQHGFTVNTASLWQSFYGRLKHVHSSASAFSDKLSTWALLEWPVDPESADSNNALSSGQWHCFRASFESQVCDPAIGLCVQGGLLSRETEYLQWKQTRKAVPQTKFTYRPQYEHSYEQIWSPTYIDSSTFYNKSYANPELNLTNYSFTRNQSLTYTIDDDIVIEAPLDLIEGLYSPWRPVVGNDGSRNKFGIGRVFFGPLFDWWSPISIARLQERKDGSLCAVWWRGAWFIVATASSLKPTDLVVEYTETADPCAKESQVGDLRYRYKVQEAPQTLYIEGRFVEEKNVEAYCVGRFCLGGRQTHRHFKAEFVRKAGFNWRIINYLATAGIALVIGVALSKKIRKLPVDTLRASPPPSPLAPPLVVPPACFLDAAIPEAPDEEESSRVDSDNTLVVVPPEGAEDVTPAEESTFLFAFLPSCSKRKRDQGEQNSKMITKVSHVQSRPAFNRLLSWFTSPSFIVDCYYSF
jgi:hypothetical protein